jgi:hypothetical protein
MGFFQDVYDDAAHVVQQVAGAAKPIAQVVSAPYTLIPQFLAQKLGNPQLQSAADIFSKSFAGFATAGISPQLLEGIQTGNFDNFRAQLVGAGKGAAIAGAGLAAGSAFGAASVVPSSQAAFSLVNNGKVDSKAIFNTLDPSGTAFGDSFGLQDLASLFGGNLPKSTSNPYVYATGAAGGYSSGYDSSYIRTPTKTDWVFYGAMAAGAALILLGGKGK